MKKIIASIIIPVRTITPYLRETVRHLKRQTVGNFEILVITDKKEELDGVKIFPSLELGPAFKRNLGAEKAKGEILAFLDDDSYPKDNWLENALKIFSESAKITGVCGPTLTPSMDNVFQKASGWVLASWLGAGGAGVYRNRVMGRREVDDFPSVNLLIRKKDFEKIGGFDINHWPGEDTKLCLDLAGLEKKIIYDPAVVVYHHRRPVFLAHLKQISRYALRRGFFAKKFPQTSFRIGYFLPSIFLAGLFLGPILAALSPFFLIIYLSSVVIYLVLLLFSGIEVFSRERNLFLALLVMLAILLTHLVYGFLFPIGFLKKDLGVIPHRIDKKKKIYLGG